jgi:AcrR family transcriptional regulator
VSAAERTAQRAGETASRGRRERPGKRNAREQILDAAVERIASDGIDDVRIARIAMDAGVSTSLVHYHFDSREALLAEALEHSFELAGDVRIGEGEGDAASHAALPGLPGARLDSLGRAVVAGGAPTRAPPHRRPAI